MALETETLISEIEISEFNQRCCCCSIHGCVKDIFTEYYDTGETEVYSEMIRNTFNINIAHDNPKNLPQFKQYLCENCILQLRNAYSLKVKLLRNYEDFILRLAKWQKSGLEDEKVNTEVQRIKSEWNNSDDTHDYLNNDVKLTTVKSEKKLHPSVKLNPEAKDKRRKLKNKDGVKKTKRTKNSRAAGTILRDNSLKLISNSSLSVFQWKGHNEYICYICRESFTDIDMLKNHTKSHTLQEIERKITNSSNGLVKVEISDLFCKICKKKHENLPDLQKHLKLHNIIVNEHLLVPFKLNNEFKCEICCKIFKNFRLLKSHILKHYQSFVCEVCGAEFYKKEYLLGHITNKHTNKKTNTKNKFKCRLCETNFPTYPRKLEHMVQNHGLKKPEFQCKLCSKVYIIKGLLNRHMKLTHFDTLKEKNYECNICFKRFYRSHDVTRHKETHSDSLNYNCGICNHYFKLKTSLGRHMRRMHSQ